MTPELKAFRYYKKNQTFKEILKSLPPLKNLFDNSKLPYEFDLMWDIKYPHGLISYLVYNPNWTDILSCLARHGYDSKKISTYILNNKESLLQDLESGDFYNKVYKI